MSISEHEVLHTHLEHESAIWLVVKARAERAGNVNAEFNRDRQESMDRIDTLLDALSMVMSREVVIV